MTHPLTDEIIESICQSSFASKNEIWSQSLRAAADWQLEQCIEELNGILSLFQLAGKVDEAERMGLLNVFKNAMRPQQQKDN